ncbi:MAG: hypothetical protein RIQ56_195 [Candidatus Parcubacteria bacterium]|jgi:CubicO group peptidase (beta-lactamase class C family)
MNEVALLDELADAALKRKVFPGCVIGVTRSGGEQAFFCYGSTKDGGTDVTRDTVYDLASVTKSIPVAALAALFISENRLRLHDLVRTYIPELQNDYGATIEDLLRYRVIGPRLSTLSFTTFEEIRTHIFETGFEGPPREVSYANVPAYLLGVVLERVGGAMLPALSHRYLFAPVGMEQTTFFPSASNCAPTEIGHDAVEVCGIVHDESARIFARARRAVGHAGLFSTAFDLSKFLSQLLKPTDEFLGSNARSILDLAQEGLGWSVNQEWFMGKYASERTIGKTGFTGTSVLVDLEKEIGIVILSNRTYPKRPSDATSLTSDINRFRKGVADILLS